MPGGRHRDETAASVRAPPGILASMGMVAIFGAGVMGETLLSGLLRAGRPADQLVITERREDRAAELTEKYGVRVLGKPASGDNPQQAFSSCGGLAAFEK